MSIVNTSHSLKRSASLAAVAATHEHHCDGGGTALVQVISSTAVGAKFSAEGRTSDDAPWILLHVMPTQDLTPVTPITETAAFTGVPAMGWRVDLQGCSCFRLRVTVLVSGAFVLQSKVSEQGYP